MNTAPVLHDLLRRADPVRYGEVEQLSPLVQRVVAPNPGPFTLHGTATFLVGARGPKALIDPGPRLPGHVRNLLRAVGAASVAQVFVTHTHLDHSPAAALLKAQVDVSVHGFGPHAGGSGSGADDGGADFDFVPDVVMRDGDVVAGDGWTLEAVHTPGHTSNHLCFRLREEGTLFSGDHVMGWASTVLSPPDGDLTAYLASLDRLLADRDRRLRPTHGPVIADPKPFLQALRSHRLRRCAEALASLRRRPRRIPELVAEHYAGLDPALAGAAGRSVCATLLHLEREGQVRAEGAGGSALWHAV